MLMLMSIDVSWQEFIVYGILDLGRERTVVRCLN